MTKNELINGLWKILNDPNPTHKDKLNQIKEFLVNEVK